MINVELVSNGSNSEIAADLLTQGLGEAPEDLLDIYQDNEHHNRIDIVEIKIDKPSVKALYMSELLIGHQDSAVDFYLDTVEQIKNLPKDMRPDVVVLSGFMQGDFKFLQKPRRATLVPELNSMDKQFMYARQMIEKIQETGVPVVYNMGNDDRRIAEEYTVEAFRKMHEYAKDEEGMNWAKIDKMRAHPLWQAHLEFQTKEVFPYCLKAGRRLYTAEEMSEKTDGEIPVEEYFVLIGVKRATELGAKVPKTFEDWLKKVKAEQNSDLMITDDFEMNIATKGRTYTDSVRHYMGFSPEPMYQNHMKPAMESMAQLACNNHETPDMFVTQHNQEEVGVSSHDKWVISTGGLIRARNFLKSSGRRTDARGDISRRLVTTRRRIPEPGASMHERTDDGRHIITFFNEVQNEKSYSLPDRLTIAELCDFQNGSISARPDMLAKYLDYIRTRALGERATAFFFGGDSVQGRNYAYIPSENQATGLMAMESQLEFTSNLIREALKDMTKEELDAIEKILIQPGNHEWNSGTLKWHGYSFTSEIRSLFERIYARAGYTDQEIAEHIKAQEAVITNRGDYLTNYTGLEYFGDIGVLIKHVLIERGGAGGGGNLPIYQAHHFANHGSTTKKSVDIYMAGHWHFPQYGVFGDTIGVVGGSMAGLSGYEYDRALDPTIAGTLLHIGGELPPQVEFVSEQALMNHKITTGGFAPKQLKAEGYKDDKDFDVARHGINMPDRYPKSALQKKILQIQRDASQRADRIAEIK